MLTTIVFSFILLSNLTPLNLALTLTVSSIVVRIVAYSSSLSIFPSAIVLISFSSGTMIVFCYCAIIANYIQKSSKSLTLTVTLIVVLPLIISTRKFTENNDNIRIIKNLSSSTIVIVRIIVVVIAIICINKSIYKKEKPLKISY